MSDMIERVERIIDDWVSRNVEDERTLARRVIEAMHEPSHAQMRACIAWAKECGREFEPIAIGYQRMIVAAQCDSDRNPEGGDAVAAPCEA